MNVNERGVVRSREARWETSDSDLGHRVAEALRGQGIDARWSESSGGGGREGGLELQDGTLAIQWQGGERGFPALVRRRVLPRDVPLMPAPWDDAVLLTEHVTSGLAEALRRRGWSGWADAAGNVDLAAPGLRLKIEGLRLNGSAGKSAEHASAPFTRSGLPVTFALLVATAEGRNPTQRELAEWARVSLGTVNRVLRALRSDAVGARYGWIGSSQGFSPEGRAVLAEDWTRAYVRTQPSAWPSRRFDSGRWFAPADVLQADLPEGSVIGSELAASAGGAPIRPEGALIYVQEESRGEVLRLGRLRAEEGGMVEIRTAFWDPALLSGASLTPPLLTRADLLLEDDPRLDDVAMQMKGQL